jgi:CRISPR system CASCADE complex protein casD
MQSWGTQSRYRRRDSGHEPSKSGVIGLIAAALGRARTEPVDDLAQLTFAVRVDAPGTLLRDYQTAKDWATDPHGTASLSIRYYLSDAVFVAAVEGGQEELKNIESALKKPVYPLYLGRRSCPAGYDLVLGIREESAEEALRNEEWHVPEYRRAEFPDPMRLRILRDAKPGEQGDLVQDVPVSFSQEHRQYAVRAVVSAEPKTVENPKGKRHSDVDFMRTVTEA